MRWRCDMEGVLVSQRRAEEALQKGFQVVWDTEMGFAVVMDSVDDWVRWQLARLYRTGDEIVPLKNPIPVRSVYG